MLRTVLTPDTENISIHLPLKYIGKKIEVLLYLVDELIEPPLPKKIIDNSWLRGSAHFTEEEYIDFQQHAKDIRKEWDKNI